MAICKCKQPSVITPPRWKLLMLTSLFCVAFIYPWEGLEVSLKDLHSLGIVLIRAILIAYLFISCIHYRFTEKYLVVCFLYIPLRRICWQRITHAQFVHAWRDPKTRYQLFINPRNVTGQIIYVTIDRCPRWYPRTTARGAHNILHPFRAFTIWLPYSRKRYFIDSFKQHHPELEIQPLDEMN